MGEALLRSAGLSPHAVQRTTSHDRNIAQFHNVRFAEFAGGGGKFCILKSYCWKC